MHRLIYLYYYLYNALEFILMRFPIQCLVLVLLWFYNSWPFPLAFIIGLITSSFIRSYQSTLLRSVNQLLSPLVFSFFLFSILLTCFNTFHFFQPPFVYKFENDLIFLRLKLKAWLDISLGSYIFFLILAWLLNLYFLNHKIIENFFRTVKVFRILMIIMIPFVSFTFFSQKKIDKLVIDQTYERKEYYKALLKNERDVTYKYLACELLMKSIPKLSLKDVTTFNLLFRSVEINASLLRDQTHTFSYYNSRLDPNYIKLSKQVLIDNFYEKNLAPTDEIQRASQIININTLSVNTKPLTIENPQSVYDLGAQIRSIKELESNISTKKLKLDKSIKTLKALFCKTVTSSFPEFNEIAEYFIDKLINEYAKHFFTINIEQRYNIFDKLDNICNIVVKEYNLIFLRPKCFNLPNSKIEQEVLSSIKIDNDISYNLGKRYQLHLDKKNMIEFNGKKMKKKLKLPFRLFRFF